MSKSGLRKTVFFTLFIICILSLAVMTSCNNKVDSSVRTDGRVSSTPVATVSPDNDDIIVLDNGILRAEIIQPGKLYTLSRFEWSGIIKQVTLNNKNTYCSEVTLEEGQGIGYGIMNAFEESNINPTVDFSEEPGEISKYLPQTVHAENSVTFVKDFNSKELSGISKSFRLEKQIILEGNKITVKQKLTNNSGRKLTTEEYGHNFTLINNKETGPDYELEFSFAPELTTVPKLNRTEVFSVNANKLEFMTDCGENSMKNTFMTEIKGYDESAKNISWKLTEKSSGASVKETVDFPADKIQIWGKADTVCTEVFVKIQLEDGESFEWSRTYEYN